VSKEEQEKGSEELLQQKKESQLKFRSFHPAQQAQPEAQPGAQPGVQLEDQMKAQLEV
jgi:hypothetical protein